MKRFITVIALAVLVQTALAQSKTLKIGDQAPGFSLPNSDGKVVSLSDYTSRGVTVVIFYRGFW